jgi:hypothetical protein
LGIPNLKLGLSREEACSANRGNSNASNPPGYETDVLQCDRCGDPTRILAALTPAFSDLTFDAY